jgi:hypothetical protein
MVVPRAMLARFPSSAALGLALALPLSALGCSSQKEPSAAPIGQTRSEGAQGRDIDKPGAPPTTPLAPEEEEPLSREELNAVAAAEEEARQAEWARTALAEVSSPSNDLGVVVAVAQRASDLRWLLAIQNRGQAPVSLAALPELLTFEVVPEPSEDEPAPAATPTTKWGKKPPPPPPQIWCGVVPKDVGAESRVTLLPSEVLVHVFDPRAYCEDSDVLKHGARIKARYGWPLETKKVWRKGKMVEETLPPKAPLAFEPAKLLETPPTAPPPASAPASSSTAGGAADAEADSTPPPVLQLKHVEAAEFVLDETYPLERIAPLGRIETPTATETTAVSTPSGTNDATDSAVEGDQASAQKAPPPPPPPPLTLTIRPMGATSNPGGTTVTVTAKNTSGASMRLFLRRELISYQVTGPNGPTTCRMTPGARAPIASAYASLGAGASASLTTRLAEACPKGTFDMPGSYTVFARIDAQNDGREHGFVAFTGTAITQQPAALTVRGSGVQSRPAMRIVSGR